MALEVHIGDGVGGGGGVAYISLPSELSCVGISC